jgi:hypothetical protein
MEAKLTFEMCLNCKSMMDEDKKNRLLQDVILVHCQNPRPEINFTCD